MYRIGFGTDFHKLEFGDGLWIGGVFLPCEFHSVAHSDGDVLLHALVDAMLGAMGAGDIGDHFPDTNNTYANLKSSFFVHETLSIVHAKKYKLVNIDCVVHLQRPKLSSVKAEICNTLSELLSIPLANVNLKCKTREGLDAIGKSNGWAADVAVLLEASS